MIHVITIHWKSAKWIDVQLRFLQQNINTPYTTYAFLNGLDHPDTESAKFDYACSEWIKPHPVKLNLLADMACFNAQSQDDVLMFIDGDAFPIAPLDDFITEKLSAHPLAAIQRQENHGDVQPHPSFCITTVGFWQSIKGDWKAGNVTWQNHFNEPVKDVGGLMLKKLNDHHASWYKLLRSNQINTDHPVLFGKYDDLIYHHGAGFRSPVMRHDSRQVRFAGLKKKCFQLAAKIMPRQYALRLFGPYHRLKVENQRLSDQMFEKICRDDEFHRRL